VRAIEIRKQRAPPLGFRVRIFHDGSVPPDPSLYIDPALLYDMAQATARGRSGSKASKKKKKKGRTVEEKRVQALAAKEAAEKSEEYIQEATKEVAGKLGESNTELIERAVRYAGMSLLNRVLDDTMTIEGHDGMMTADGTRRRSAGGVFLHLLAQRLTHDQQMLVFQRMTTPNLAPGGFGPPIPDLGSDAFPLASSAPTAIPSSGLIMRTFDDDVELSTSLGSSAPQNLLSGSLDSSFNINAEAFVPRARQDTLDTADDLVDGMASLSSSVDAQGPVHADDEMMFS